MLRSRRHLPPKARYMHMAPRRRTATGFSLIEVAIVVLIIGVVAAIAMGAFSSAFGSRNERSAGATGNTIIGAMFAYAKQHHRLPCPDNDGDAREDGIGSACLNGLQVGQVPYQSIGLAVPPTVEKAMYAVYRNPSINADLVAPVAGVPQRSDLQHALQAAARSAGVNPSYVYITGDGERTGAIDCASNPLLHPAFVIVVPLRDRDGNGSAFDGVDTALLSGSSLCAASPSRAPDAVFDDHVALVGFSTLLGVISRNAP